MKTALMIMDAVLAILLIGVVVMQSGKSAGISGAISGGAETLLGGKRKGIDEMLSKATMIIGALFLVVTLALHLAIR